MYWHKLSVTTSRAAQRVQTEPHCLIKRRLAAPNIVPYIARKAFTFLHQPIMSYHHIATATRRCTAPGSPRSKMMLLVASHPVQNSRTHIRMYTEISQEGTRACKPYYIADASPSESGSHLICRHIMHTHYVNICARAASVCHTHIVRCVCACNGAVPPHSASIRMCAAASYVCVAHTFTSARLFT